MITQLTYDMVIFIPVYLILGWVGKKQITQRFIPVINASDLECGSFDRFCTSVFLDQAKSYICIQLPPTPPDVDLELPTVCPSTSGSWLGLRRFPI